jgi:YD repeat-containing protein
MTIDKIHLKFKSLLIFCVCFLITFSLPLKSWSEVPSSATSLKFQAVDLVSQDSIPPFIIKRIYNSEEKSGGIFGPSWFCWPLDAAISQTTIDDKSALFFHTEKGQKEIFIQVEEGLYVPTNPDRISRSAIFKNESGYVLSDLISGKHIFDKSGHLTAIYDTYGNSFKIVRDINRNPSAVITSYPNEKTYKIKIDTDLNRLSEISSPDGNKWQYQYDKKGQLVKVINPSGIEKSYKYKKNRLTERAYLNGRWIKYKYDKNSHLIEINRNGRVETRKYTYDKSSPKDWAVTKTDPIGRVSQYQFLDSKRQEVIREKDGNVIVKQYNKDWQLEHISSLKEGVTSYTRDELGRPISVMDGLNKVTQIRYDNAFGLPSTVINEQGQVTRLKYNARGKIEKILPSDGRKVSVLYNQFGELKTVKDSFDQQDKPQTSESSQKHQPANKNNAGVIFYSIFNKPAFQNIPISKQRSEFAQILFQSEIIKKKNQKQVIQTAAGKKWESTFDIFGNLVKITENKKRIAAFHYDAADRLLEVIYPDGTSELFDYDDADNIIYYQNPDEKIYQYEYNLQGNLIKQDFPDGATHTFDYDLQGRLIGAFNSFWHDLFDYDLKGRITRIGLLTPEISTPETIVSYTYGEESRLKSKLYHNGMKCEYQYDAQKNTETISFLSTRLVMAKDDDGRCRSLQIAPLYKAEFGYNEEGDLTRLALLDSKSKTIGSQFCQYKNGSLFQVFSSFPGNKGTYSIAYNNEGHPSEILFNKEPVEPPVKKHLKMSFDVFGRLRLTGAETPATMAEYSYGINGLIHKKSSKEDIWIIRSSDGIPRAMILNGKIQIIIWSAIPDNAFLLDPGIGEIQNITFHDSMMPFIEINHGG